MPTVHREAGFRVIIRTDDHPPPHVHVFGDGEAKVILKGADGGPEIVYQVSMSSADFRRIMRILRQQADMLAARWTAIHG